MSAETLQVQSELDIMLALYKQVQPERILEIGVWMGGTLQHWLAASWYPIVVAVDDEHRNYDVYQEWNWRSVFYPYTGNSTSRDVTDCVHKHAPYDWVFIDGDHSYDVVSQDVENYLPMVAPGGYLLLHDICPPHDMDEYGPGIIFDELTEFGYSTTAIIDRGNHADSHGIGIVRQKNEGV